MNYKIVWFIQIQYETKILLMLFTNKKTKYFFKMTTALISNSKNSDIGYKNHLFNF